jgi:exonuclease III
MNVQTLQELGWAEDLANCMNKQGIAVCGIQEHRRVHTTDMMEEIESKRVNDHYLLTSSAWRNSQNAATGGVGIVINSLAHRTMIKANRYTDRIMSASFRSKPVLSVIVAYAPTEEKSETLNQEFYGQLRTVIEAVPQHHFLAILGDLNKRLGKDDARFTYHEAQNNNGARLSKILEDYQLLAMNTLY